MNWQPKLEYTELNSGLSKSIILPIPDSDPYNEETKTSASTTRSTNGTAQTQYNYTLQRYTLKFLYVDKATTDKVRDFINLHAHRGGNFKFYWHSDEIDFGIFELKAKTFKISRPLPDGAGDFEYNFSFTIERVLDLEYTYEVENMIALSQAEILNNQSSFVDVDGMAITGIRSALLHYQIYRNTTDAGATELAGRGTLYITYKTVENDYHIENAVEGGDDPGILDWNITSAGQVQYKSSNMTGSNYEGYINFWGTYMEPAV